jgi:cobyrinic acid a,c-diamide synthase
VKLYTFVYHMDHSSLPPTLVIAGGASGVGKSVFSVGLMATLRMKGLVIQAFKVGPGMPDALFVS